MDLAKRIMTRKNDLGITWKEIGIPLHLSVRTVQQWGQGKTIPRSCDIPDICKVLECTPNYLFGFSEDVNG